MLKKIFAWLRKPIVVKYCRIKAPKKGEKILFILPTNDIEEVKRFGEKLQRFKNEPYWVISENIKVRKLGKANPKVRMK